MNTNLKVDVQEFYPRNNCNSMENGGGHHQSENVPAVNGKAKNFKDKESVRMTSYASKKTGFAAVDKLAEQENIKKKQNANDTNCENGTSTIPPNITTSNNSNNVKNAASRDTSIKSSSQLSNPNPPISSSMPAVVKAAKTTKKEIIESLKSMEQQNIDLMANNKMQQQLLNQQKQQQQQEIEWNVIRSSKGKRIKFTNKHLNGNNEKIEQNEVAVETPVKSEETQIEKPKEESTQEEGSSQPKDSPIIVSKNLKKAKKPKNKKNSSKKVLMTGKLEGFEIIEPEFGVSTENKSADEPEIMQESDNEFEAENETEIVDQIEIETESVTLLTSDIAQEDNSEKVQNIEEINVTKPEIAEPIVLPKTIPNEYNAQVENSIVEELLLKTRASPHEDEIIDINDNDIRCSIIATEPPQIVEEIEKIVRIHSAPKTVEENLSFIVADLSESNDKDVEIKEISEKFVESKVSIVPVEALETVIEEKLDVVEVTEEKIEKKMEMPLKAINKSASPPKETVIPRGSPKKDLTSTKSRQKSKEKDPKDTKAPKEKSVNQKEKRNSVKDKKDLKEKTPEIPENHPLLDKENFKKENIAELEREVAENLKMLDTDIEIKSPIIMKNLITDFPITNAIKQWLNEKQNESFDKLFYVPNDPKIQNKIYNVCSSTMKSGNLKKPHLTNGHVENGGLVDFDAANGESDEEDDMDGIVKLS